MTPEELLEEWTDGETSGLRPQRIQRIRDDLMEHTDMFVPRRIPEIESWLERMKGHVTSKLKEEVADGDEE